MPQTQDPPETFIETNIVKNHLAGLYTKFQAFEASGSEEKDFFLCNSMVHTQESPETFI